MSSFWNLKEFEGVYVLELNVPDTEVNVLTTQCMAELNAFLLELKDRKDIRALLIASAKKRIFIAGADIKEIQKIRTHEEAIAKADEGKSVFKLLEDLPYPVVSVINGACLGGGYELSLACDAIVASFSEDVKVGLPEVKLGILPGFGGSIRLPVRLGLLQALPLILAGKVCSASDALRRKMVDRLFPGKTLLRDAASFAKTLTSKKKKKPPRAKSLANRFLNETAPGRNLVFRQALKDVHKRSKGFYPAPIEIIELIKRTYGDTSEKAYALESEHFARLAVTNVSKNLVKLFFLNEQYKKYAWTSNQKKFPRVQKCGVLGAGVMGGGIAQLVSSKEIPVRVKDIQQEALGSALAEAQKIYQGELKRRKIKKHELERKIGLISTSLNFGGFERCSFIIEAVVENLEVKRRVFEEMSREVSEDTILASNTSSLSVTQMAEVCKAPERVVGLHFFNPVHRMPLVEIIRAEQTSEDTLEKTVQFARALGKTVIVVKDSPGFLVNRLLLPYMNEAAYLLEEGMGPEKIDAIATRFGMPMGPVALADQVGIDVGCKVADVLYQAFGGRMKVASILHTAKEKGFLGKKNKKGFYLYDGKALRRNPGLKLSARSAVTRCSDEDALKRMIYVMINEAARCLNEGVVDAPGTVDVGMIFGTGFPPFRAGLLRYADAVGLDLIVRDLKRFAGEVDPERFQPAPYLLKLVEAHQNFYNR